MTLKTATCCRACLYNRSHTNFEDCTCDSLGHGSQLAPTINGAPPTCTHRKLCARTGCTLGKLAKQTAPHLTAPLGTQRVKGRPREVELLGHHVYEVRAQRCCAMRVRAPHTEVHSPAGFGIHLHTLSRLLHAVAPALVSTIACVTAATVCTQPWCPEAQGL